MDMPNVKPATTTIELLKEKQQIAAKDSLVNYSFYLGATADNHDHLTLEQITIYAPHDFEGSEIYSDEKGRWINCNGCGVQSAVE